MVVSQLCRFLGTDKSQRARYCCCKYQDCLTYRGCCWGRGSGCYLTFLYMFVKLLYISNIVAQLCLLSLILHSRYIYYGFEVVRGFAADHNWHEQPLDIFPRISMCDVYIRQLDNIHRYTVQCSLNLNIFNEKIYIILWFWYLFVLAMTVLGLLHFLLKVVCPCERVYFVRKQLTTSSDDTVKGTRKSVKSKKMLERFIWDYLRSDGVFVLRLISDNTTPVACRDITQCLWERWCVQEDAKEEFVFGRDETLLPL